MAARAAAQVVAEVTVRNMFKGTILVIFLSLTLGVNARESCPPTPVTHVTDEQNLMLSKLARRDISTRLNQYDLKTGRQIFVWVGATTSPDDAEFSLHDKLFRFAYRCFNSWGIGRKGVNDGVAIFFFVADDASWVATGYGAVKKIPNQEAERIHREVISPLMRAKKYEEAVISGVNAVISDMERNETIPGK